MIRKMNVFGTPPILPDAMLLSVLDNDHGPARDIVVLNAGLALYAANVANSMQVGVQLARDAIESGASKAKLEQLVAEAIQ